MTVQLDPPLQLTQTVAPTAEPVTVAEAKAQCRVDHADEDAFISTLITAARQLVEKHTGRALMSQTWQMPLDRWPDCSGHDGDRSQEIRVPLPPLQSVSSITYLDSDGVSQTVATSVYTVDTASLPGRIYPAYSQTWPTHRAVPAAITVTFVAGYTSAANVPAAVRQAILLLVADMFEHRERHITGTIIAMFPTVDALLAGYTHREFF